jgi:hypothetical protein
MQIEKINIDAVFQSLAYWHGYQSQRYPNLALREIAIAHEFAALMSSALKNNAKVKSEVAYSEIFDSSNISRSEVRKNDKKIDVLIDFSDVKSKPDGKLYKVCVEIKRLKIGVRGLESDVDKLSKIRSKNNYRLDRWVLVCGYGLLPKTSEQKRWAQSGAIERARGKSRPITTKAGNKYCIARIYKASSARAKNGVPHKSNYVILVEVLV